MFSILPLCCCLVVSTSAIDCLERLVSEMTCYVLSSMLNPTHSFTFVFLNSRPLMSKLRRWPSTKSISYVGTWAGALVIATSFSFVVMTGNTAPWPTSGKLFQQMPAPFNLQGSTLFRGWGSYNKDVVL